MTIRTLDSVLKEQGICGPALIKIDVEGAETRVLQGARKTLARWKPYLVIDLHSPAQAVSVAGLLTDLGCRFERFNTRFPEQWPPPVCDSGSLFSIPIASKQPNGRQSGET